MNDYKKQLEDIQNEIQSKKEEKIRLQERLSNLQEEQKKHEETLKELGIEKFEDLEKIIESLESEIKEEIEKIQGQLK